MSNRGYFLALDVGNTRIKAAVFSQGQVINDNHFTIGTATEWDLCIKALDHQMASLGIRTVGIVSVVPERSNRLAQFLRQRQGVTVRIFEASVSLPFKLAYKTPDTLGMDRLAAAIGAWNLVQKQYNPPFPHILAIDAGTAINYEVISCDGRYLGGPISPGPILLQQALALGTAQLPVVTLDKPDNPVGRSTREALQSGIMYMMLDSVLGMKNRIANQLDGELTCILTGGWGAWIKRNSNIDAIYEPHLVLKGVASVFS